MVEAIAVSDQGVGDATQVQEPVPVGIVAGEAGDLEAEDDAHSAERDFGRILELYLESFTADYLRLRTVVASATP